MNTNVVKHMTQLERGKSYPAPSLIKESPEVAALVSKLVGSINPVVAQTKSNHSHHTMTDNRLREMSRVIQTRVTDNENIMQLFPDIELCAQILVSSILSPKDMVTTEVIYRVKDSILPPEVTQKLLDTLKDTLEDHYGLKQQLPHLLREILFDAGSHVIAILPESSVDAIINRGLFVATEHLPDLFTPQREVVSLGYLGNSDKTNAPKLRTGLEAFTYTPLNVTEYDGRIAVEERTTSGYPYERVSVTDNYDYLKVPQIVAHNHQVKVQISLDRRRAALEGRQLSNQDVEHLLYKNPRTGAVPFLSVQTQEDTPRESIGRPLTLKLPPESVIPVHVPGNPKKHVGYFILIDEEGNPISRMSAYHTLNSLGVGVTDMAQPITSFLLQKARRNLLGPDPDQMGLDQAATIYGALIEKDLITRVKNGMYGANVEIGDNQEIYRIMLARTLANQYTKLLYIPAELVSYFAFAHHHNGIGKSLLDNLKVLTSLRGILLFAKVMAESKNAIAQTQVKIQLDPNDPDPQKTIEHTQHEVLRLRQQYFPLGINSPVDLADWVQRAGIEFSFEGHLGLPQIKFDFDTRKLDHNVPDSDLDESLRKQTYMSVGLNPEVVDNGFNSEFATTVVSNNILLSKRISNYQEDFTPQITRYVKILAGNDAKLRQDLREILKKHLQDVRDYINKKEIPLQAYDDDLRFCNAVLDLFIEDLELDLPRPDLTTLENQSEAFNHYSEALDAALSQAFIDQSIVTSDLGGTIGNNIDAVKAAYKAYFLRKWMADNNYLSELMDIISTNEDGMPMINLSEATKTHIEGLMLGASDYIKSAAKIKQKTDAELEKAGAGSEGFGGGGGGSFDTSSSGSSDTFGGGESDSFEGTDDFGSDDFGMSSPEGKSPPEEPSTPTEEETGLSEDQTEEEQAKAEEEEANAQEEAEQQAKEEEEAKKQEEQAKAEEEKARAEEEQRKAQEAAEKAKESATDTKDEG
jgi:hypothetical protein